MIYLVVLCATDTFYEALDQGKINQLVCTRIRPIRKDAYHRYGIKDEFPRSLTRLPYTGINVALASSASERMKRFFIPDRSIACMQRIDCDLIVMNGKRRALDRDVTNNDSPGRGLVSHFPARQQRAFGGNSFTDFLARRRRR
jgi:hypothetical protein